MRPRTDAPTTTQLPPYSAEEPKNHFIHRIGPELDCLVGEVCGIVVLSKWIQIGLVYCKVVDDNNRNHNPCSGSVANGNLSIESALDH